MDMSRRTEGKRESFAASGTWRRLNTATSSSKTRHPHRDPRFLQSRIQCAETPTRSLPRHMVAERRDATSLEQPPRSGTHGTAPARWNSDSTSPFRSKTIDRPAPHCSLAHHHCDAARRSTSSGASLLGDSFAALEQAHSRLLALAIGSRAPTNPAQAVRIPRVRRIGGQIIDASSRPQVFSNPDSTKDSRLLPNNPALPPAARAPARCDLPHAPVRFATRGLYRNAVVAVDAGHFLDQVFLEAMSKRADDGARTSCSRRRNLHA